MASLIDDLARRLGTSPGEARQHLQKLLAELASSAKRNGHASLPGLGTFVRKDGAWTFEPEEALARSVNRSFADLEPVGVSTSATPAEKPAPEETPSAAEDDAAEQERAAPAQRNKGTSIFDRREDDEEDEGEPARGLFSPEPAASEEHAPPARGEDRPAPLPERQPPERRAAREERAPETEQPGAAADDASPSPPEEDDPWAFPAGPPADTSEPPEEDAPAAPLPSWSYAALPAGYLVHRRTPLQSSQLRDARLEPLPAPPSPRNAPAADAPAAEKQAEPKREDDPSEDRRATDRASKAPPQAGGQQAGAPKRGRRQKPRSGSGLRWLVTLLILLAVGLGAWYVLGQQGVVTGPVAALQGGAPAEETAAPSPPESAPGEEAPANEGASEEAADAGETGPPATDQSTPGERAFAEAARLDRAQGGWTAVVASVTSRAEAEQVAQRFAQEFEGQNYPIDILQTTVDGTRRFRVVVGQFASPDQVIQAIESGADRFPDDSWGLEIESGA